MTGLPYDLTMVLYGLHYCSSMKRDGNLSVGDRENRAFLIPYFTRIEYVSCVEIPMPASDINVL